MEIISIVPSGSPRLPPIESCSKAVALCLLWYVISFLTSPSFEYEYVNTDILLDISASSSLEIFPHGLTTSVEIKAYK